MSTLRSSRRRFLRLFSGILGFVAGMSLAAKPARAGDDGPAPFPWVSERHCGHRLDQPPDRAPDWVIPVPTGLFRKGDEEAIAQWLRATHPRPPQNKGEARPMPVRR